MSRENVELVAARLRAFDERLRATDVTVPDFVWDLTMFDGWPDTRLYTGPDGFNEFFAKWTEPYDEFEQRTGDVIDAGGDNVVAAIYQRGRLRGSDSWVENRFGIVFTITDRAIRRALVFRTAEEALQHVGLPA